jgi:O-antigen/teichoic acid export membrane protein
VLLAVSLYAMFRNQFGLGSLVFAVIVASFGLLMLAVYEILKTVRIELTAEPGLMRLLSFQGNYFASTLSLTILSLADRIFIEKYFGKDAVGDYYYVSLIATFPFIMLQNYVGFVALPILKSRLNRKTLIRMAKKVGLFILPIFVSMSLLYSISTYLAQIDIPLATAKRLIEELSITDASLFIVLVLIGIMRVMYGLCSSVVGVSGTPRALVAINTFNLITVFALILMLLIIKPDSPFIVASLFALGWLFRLLVFGRMAIYYADKKYENVKI